MKRLLIVDDEKIYQMMVYHAVKSMGFEIEVLGDGADASKFVADGWAPATS